jgi:drug/metabolite transporter (DMT)-like permease
VGDSEKNRDLITAGAFVAMVIIYGSSWVAVRFSDRELEPFWGAALRLIVSAVILILASAALHRPRPRGRALVGSLAYGVLGSGLNNVLLYWALLVVTASLGSVIYATIPLIILFLAAAIGLERFRWRALGGAVIAAGGIAVIFAGEIGTKLPITSIVAIALAAICTSSGMIVVKSTQKTDPISMNAFALCSGAIILLAASFASGERIVLPTLATTWYAVGWLIMSSTVGSILYVWVISRWSASRVSYYAVLSPLVTFATAALSGSETFSTVFLLGSGCVLIGVYLGALRSAPRSVLPDHRTIAEGTGV